MKELVPVKGKFTSRMLEFPVSKVSIFALGKQALFKSIKSKLSFKTIILKIIRCQHPRADVFCASRSRVPAAVAQCSTKLTCRGLRSLEQIRGQHSLQSMLKFGTRDQ
jgi:hypothetical protein